MPSLNGSCGLASGRWIARRLGCAGAWENAPRTVNNPATASTRNTNPALRFSTDLLSLCIASSVDLRCVVAVQRGRECIPGWVRMQAGRSGGRHARRRGRFFRGPLARSDTGHLGDNLCGSRFAYSAIAVVNAALRQSEIAPASAALGIEFMKRGLPLLLSEPGGVHARQFAGAIGVREENLAAVFKRFHARIDRQAEQSTDFCFIEGWVAQSFMLLHNASLRVQHKRRGQRRNAAILNAYFRRGHRYWI